MYGLILYMSVALGFADPGTEYALGPGDEVDVVVHGIDFGRSSFVVNSDGTVSFPYVGQVEVAGLTSVQAERKFRLALMDGYLVDPQVSIRINEYASQPVDLIGAVANPGVVRLQGPTTVRALLAERGGAVADKAGQNVVVHRNDLLTRIPLDALEGPSGDFMVVGGDVVEVEVGIGASVYMAGEVAQPGAIAFSKGLTASQALLQAGGSGEFARLSGAYIVRGDEQIKINLKRVLKGKESDLQLQPGDRLVVPLSAL